MSASRLPTEPTNRGYKGTGPLTRYISLTAYVWQGSGDKTYGVVPWPPEDCPQAFGLARQVYDESLGHAGGAPPLTKSEWEKHVHHSCATTEYPSYRPVLNTEDFEQDEAATCELRTAWITVNKDDYDNGRLSFWMSMSCEVESYDHFAQFVLATFSKEIAKRSAVLLGSEANWELDANILYAAGEVPDADLRWYRARVEDAAQSVLCEHGITHIRVNTRTAHWPLPTGSTALPMPNSHQHIMGLIWVPPLAAA